MKTKLIGVLALLAGSALFAAPRVAIGVGIGVPAYGYGYGAPAPVYAAPPPPPAITATLRPRSFMRFLRSIRDACGLAEAGGFAGGARVWRPRILARWSGLSRRLAPVS